MNPPTKRPPALHRVLIVCKRYTCLGYLDDDGQWRMSYSNEIIRDIVGWMELDGSDGCRDADH